MVKPRATPRNTQLGPYDVKSMGSGTFDKSSNAAGDDSAVGLRHFRVAHLSRLADRTSDSPFRVGESVADSTQKSICCRDAKGYTLCHRAFNGIRTSIATIALGSNGSYWTCGF